MDKQDRNENGNKRAAIEGTNSALKRTYGVGKLRFRGLVRCRLTMGLKTIAHNFHQIVRFFHGDTRQKYKKIADTCQGILATREKIGYVFPNPILSPSKSFEYTR